ncbi:hypothetical protein ASPWEDRAFT_41302 [Aspergillus wentii DTO 134E9]|uniref:Uncharacterized protein n=1 Tax=Aspergillus wentii DTO 134E9 TaxID=1073089 RepID=A0A1L9RM96_ASPWE|nr:uncharacterized protein ASPWEDRAFT_41302 [Aspergillus wentii DTO 134E9]KAI9929488.1 hypothetical protein MW887_000961 [Aspergillus wentii]OJJ36069.1 hypothetical protein ASPWEDRAFT_41302 [Aspergillus wentii DTO 134E9]
MRLNIAITSLFLAGASAQLASILPIPLPTKIPTLTPSASPSSTPSSSASVSPSSSASISAYATPSSTPSLNPDEYDCILNNQQCSWHKSEFGYGSDYCGSSPYRAGQKLSSGNTIVAVEKSGESQDCVRKAGVACCKAFETACRRGEKYLECEKA